MGLQIQAKNKRDTEAQWKEYQGVKVLLAPIDNEQYQITLERARRLMARQDQEQSLENLSATARDRRELDIQCDALGRYIIKDWEGSVTDESGAPVRYSPEAAAALLSTNLDFFSFVAFTAAEIALDKASEAEEIVGKPSPDSDGNANGQDKGKSES